MNVLRQRNAGTVTIKQCCLLSCDLLKRRHSPFRIRNEPPAMRNLIILGSGRSGTSVAAGLFRRIPNIFFGYDVLRPSEANPRGYFEDEVVNAINNLLIRQMTGTALLDVIPPRLLPWVERWFPWMHRDTRSLWLACPRRPLAWRLGYDLGHLICKITSHQPFCLKDPRFSFTLPLWQPYLPERTRFLVVFRDPARTVNSMLRDAKELYPGRPLPLTKRWAIDHWSLAYRRIMEQRSAVGVQAEDWLLVDSDDVISGAALAAIECFAECRVDVGHVDVGLMHVRPIEASEKATAKCADVYRELRATAEQDLRRCSQAALSR
jgi:hypothetical protein